MTQKRERLRRLFQVSLATPLPPKIRRPNLVDDAITLLVLAAILAVILL